MTSQQERPVPDISDTKRFWVWLVLVGILLSGAVLRVSYLREIVKSPSFSHPQIDAGYHDYWARALAGGDWKISEGFTETGDPEIRTIPYFRPPGYPYFLAFVYYLSGGSYLAARIFQMSLGLVNCLLAYLLAKRLFGCVTGLIAAAFMAVYWGFIYFEGELLEPVLLVTLALLLMHILLFWYDRFTFLRGILAGIAFGLFALVRPNILLFGPVILCWSLWVWREKGQGRQLAVMWLGFVLGSAGTIAPATIRNYVVADDFVLITSNAGINLYIGNNENSTGGYAVIPEAARLGVDEMWSNFDYPKILRGVEALEGRKMKYSELSSYFTDKAIDYIRGHPGRFLKLLAIKTAYFWGPAEIPSNKEIYYEKLNSVTLRHMPGFAMALSAALIGLVQLLLGRKKPEATATTKQFAISALIILFMVIYFVSHLPFFVAGRFRVPVIPFLFVFGAYGAELTGRLAVYRHFREAGCWVIVFSAFYILSSMQIVPYRPDLSRWHYGRGVCYSSAGQFIPAVVEYRQAVELKPDFAEAYYNLGYVLAQQDRFNEAADNFRRAIQLRPNYTEAYYNLGYVLQFEGKYDESVSNYRKVLYMSPGHTRAHNNLGLVFQSQGKFSEAIGCYREAIRISPDFVLAHYNLGMVLVSIGQIDEAIEHFRQAVDLAPDWWEPLNGLAWLLVAYVKPVEASEAISFAERAAELTGYRNASVLDTLAAAYAAGGQFSHAVEFAEAALEQASKAGANNLAEEIRSRLELYKQSKPYREAVRQ